jgi:hypothetical protein
MNTLTYAFGPEIPVNLEAIGLSFLAAPHLQSDSSIAVLSAERYVRENYAHKRLNSLYSGAIGQVINVNITYRGTDINGLYDVDNVISLSGQVTLSDGHFRVPPQSNKGYRDGS